MKQVSQLKSEARNAMKGSGLFGTTFLFFLLIIGIAFGFGLLIFICSFLSTVGQVIGYILGIAYSGVLLALYYKYAAACLDVSRGEKRKLRHILNFDAPNTFFRSFLALFVPFLFMYLWALVVMIPFFIFLFVYPDAPPWLLVLIIIFVLIPPYYKFYSYSQTPFIANDNPEMGILACNKKSIAMMKGKKLKLLWLDVTFFSWYLLLFILSSAPILLNYAKMIPGNISLLLWLVFLVVFFIFMLYLTPYWVLSRANFYKDLIANDDKDFLNNNDNNFMNNNNFS